MVEPLPIPNPHSQRQDGGTELGTVAGVGGAVDLEWNSDTISPADARVDDTASAASSRLSVIAAGTVCEHEHLLREGIADEAMSRNRASVPSYGEEVDRTAVRVRWVETTIAIGERGIDPGLIEHAPEIIRERIERLGWWGLVG